ncbi:MAG: hypothetical protein E7169_01325 [Firmicutes bacterium]|nr:hypothetical protein [Bacillota bacterium]
MVKLKDAYEFCELLKIECIKQELESHLVGYKVNSLGYSMGKFSFSLSNDNGEKIELCIYEKSIIFSKRSKYLVENFVIEDDLKLLQTNVEKRSNGVMVTNITKNFDFSERFNSQIVLADIIEDTYVFDKEKSIDLFNITSFEDIKSVTLFIKVKEFEHSNSLEKNANCHSKFSTHMNYLLPGRFRGGYVVANSCSNHTYLNGEEVSRLYDIVDGADKLYRIYDLYHGIINPRNELDINCISLGLISPYAFSLRNLRGIDKNEEKIIGKSKILISNDYCNYVCNLLKDKYNCDIDKDFSRDTILEGIGYYLTEDEKQEILAEEGLTTIEESKGFIKKFISRFKNKKND